MVYATPGDSRSTSRQAISISRCGKYHHRRGELSAGSQHRGRKLRLAYHRRQHLFRTVGLRKGEPCDVEHWICSAEGQTAPVSEYNHEVGCAIVGGASIAGPDCRSAGCFPLCRFLPRADLGTERWSSGQVAKPPPHQYLQSHQRHRRRPGRQRLCHRLSKWRYLDDLRGITRDQVDSVAAMKITPRIQS